tara:strand:+ start:9354 stop:9608 length:255 start_codon:yes stop_codon:yes gene_type:complete
MSDGEDMVPEDPNVFEDSWEQEEARVKAYRTFPAKIEYVADTTNGPKVVEIDLRELSMDELEALIPYNKSAYLEILHRELRNTD